MFLPRRPTPAEIAAFLRASADLTLSYETVGLAKDRPHGFDVDEQTVVIGAGAASFARAKAALAEWRHFELGWVELFPKAAPIAPGTVVAVLVHHLGFWSLNGCRIVYEVGEGAGIEFGFAYGTLTNHGESGEEIFSVSIHPKTGDVTYMIRAVAKPQAVSRDLAIRW